MGVEGFAWAAQRVGLGLGVGEIGEVLGGVVIVGGLDIGVVVGRVVVVGGLFFVF